MKYKSAILYSLFFAGCFAVSQAAGFYAYKGGFGSFLNLLYPIFGKMLLPNYNFAFGLPLPHVLAYILYPVILAFFSYWYLSGEKTALGNISYAMVMAGALSNLVERAYLGYVRDFIYSIWGSVFNLADVLIIFGIILIVISTMKPRERG